MTTFACGFSWLQHSWSRADLHVDMNREAMKHMVSLVKPLQYDLVKFSTGDFGGRNSGPFGDTSSRWPTSRELFKDRFTASSVITIRLPWFQA